MKKFLKFMLMLIFALGFSTAITSCDDDSDGSSSKDIIHGEWEGYLIIDGYYTDAVFKFDKDKTLTITDWNDSYYGTWSKNGNDYTYKIAMGATTYSGNMTVATTEEIAYLHVYQNGEKIGSAEKEIIKEDKTTKPGGMGSSGSIVGTWEYREDDQDYDVFIFKSNGQFTYSMTMYDWWDKKTYTLSQIGTYTFNKSTQKLVLKTSKFVEGEDTLYIQAEETYMAYVNGNTLIISDTDGSNPCTYIRK